MDDFHEDLTFAPHFSSTCNFSEAARLASTPFNPSADIGCLPAPPLSTIKAAVVEDAASHTILTESKLAQHTDEHEDDKPYQPHQDSFDNTPVNQPRKSMHLRYALISLSTLINPSSIKCYKEHNLDLVAVLTLLVHCCVASIIQ